MWAARKALAVLVSLIALAGVLVTVVLATRRIDLRPRTHSLMLAAIAATCASVWVRAFLAHGISRSTSHAQRSDLTAAGERMKTTVSAPRISAPSRASQSSAA